MLLPPVFAAKIQRKPAEADLLLISVEAGSNLSNARNWGGRDGGGGEVAADFTFHPLTKTTTTSEN